MKSLLLASLTALLASACTEPGFDTVAGAAEGGAGLLPSNEILPRSSWAAASVVANGQGECGRISYPRMLTVHHSEFEPRGTDLEAVRSIQTWHQQSTWCDIGYHAAVGTDGTMIRGRADERRRGVHTTGATNPLYPNVEAGNAGNLGIVLLGDLAKREPRTEQLAALARFAAWTHRVYGMALDRETIRGHGERNQTGCPGKEFVDIEFRSKDLLTPAVECAQQLARGNEDCSASLGTMVQLPVYADPDIAISVVQRSGGVRILVDAIGSQTLSRVVLGFSVTGDVTPGSWQVSGGLSAPPTAARKGAIELGLVQAGDHFEIETDLAFGPRRWDYGADVMAWLQIAEDETGMVRYGEQLRYQYPPTYEQAMAEPVVKTLSSWTAATDSCDSALPGSCPAAPINAYGSLVQSYLALGGERY